MERVECDINISDFYGGYPRTLIKKSASEHIGQRYMYSVSYRSHSSWRWYCLSIRSFLVSFEPLRFSPPLPYPLFLLPCLYDGSLVPVPEVFL